MRLRNLFHSYTFDAEQGETKQLNQMLIFWIAVVALFAVATISLETALLPFAAMLDKIRSSPEINSYLQAVSGKFASLDREGMLRLVTVSVIIPIKKIVFLLSVATLLFWPLKSLRRAPWLLLGGRARLWIATKAFCFMALLVFPLRLRSLGDSYAHMSISPFDEPFGVLYRRLLMPAIANIFGLSGYVFFLALSLIIAFVLLYILLVWLEKSDVKVNQIFLVSLLTCSFFIYAFEMPGYPDQLAMIFLILIVLLPLSELGKLSLAALALATHEASVLMLFPVVLFTFSQKEQQRFFLLILLYGLLALAGAGFDIRSLVNIHSSVGAAKPLTYFIENPLLLFAGVFIGYKLFWIAIGIAVVKTWNIGDRRLSLFILVALFTPLIILPFAVDTSRLAGLGFFGMLLAVKFLMERNIINPAVAVAFSIANLLIPSFYVGLNSGIVFQPGLYRLVWWWMF